ncbi:hypothetical protein QBC34DRAFT_304578 [Podospora aff. communis PSN243]|uniref:Ecp2 effector protein domain-containing protein n=1 Tax=Podospora aff. communis PSN243 TaxID=3040156 RepID=A0AAV9GDY9_9PEZI|nr:hypothetical protein QBC34DRAFT_304578 [Podospora aff. communis PSN243]
MNLTELFTTLLATASLVSATALPEQPKLPDGLYKSYIDDTGNEVTDFVPWNELSNTTFVPVHSVVPGPKLKPRANLMKRKEGCHASVNIPSSVTDAANKCLIDSFTSDPVVTTAGGYRRYSCIYSNAVSYICSYNVYTPGHHITTTIKYKSDIRGSWDYVKRTLCGFNRLGYAQVINGVGDVTAGYTFNGDKFCW